MFTGIVTDTVDILSAKPTEHGLTLRVDKPPNWHEVRLGESIAVDGVCLTTADIGDDLVFNLVPETLSKTTFGAKVPGRVNLERALTIQERLGGHFVQGHVDGMGEVLDINKSNGWHLTILFSEQFKPLVIGKGSICVNGVSLTVVDAGDNSFTVALVPYTLAHTTLESLQPGDKVNLEFDMVGKYIINYMKLSQKHAKNSKS